MEQNQQSHLTFQFSTENQNYFLFVVIAIGYFLTNHLTLYFIGIHVYASLKYTIEYFNYYISFLKKY